MPAKWAGRRVQQMRDALATITTWPTRCALCGHELQRSDDWRAGHIADRETHPDLTWDLANLRIECPDCSDAGGQASVQRAAATRTLTALGLNPADHTREIEQSIRTSNTRSVLPTEGTHTEPPPLPVSLSEGRSTAMAAHDGSIASQDGQNGGKGRLLGSTPSLTLGSGSEALRSAPVASGGVEVPEWLRWDPERLAAFPWLAPFVVVPSDASPPLAMTPPHPDAVGSYGAEAIAWIEEAEGKRLRWWQRLAITRQLEHDAIGALIWDTVVESGTRRIGKSVRLRGTALWRMEFGPSLFGERQEVVHTGSDLAVCRKAQKVAWPWARSHGWKVTAGNGKEAIESPDGDAWLVRAQDAVYGLDTTLGLVDEGWKVKPDTVSEGLEPSLMERRSPQLHLTSTAHRRATSMMRTNIADALASEPGTTTLLLLWAAPAGADSGDPATWRAASAFWSPARARMIAKKYKKALAGEVDPEADDLDPMAGFEAQYLNRWSLRPVKVVPGTPVVTDTDWAGLAVSTPVGRPDAVSVEGWPGERLSVARGWRDGDRAVVDAQDVADVASAAALVASWGVRSVSVGADMVDDPAWREHGLRASSESGSVLAAVGSLSRLLTDGVLRHTGGEHLSGQVLDLRVSPSPAGLRLRSSARSDAVKAAVRAAQAARARPVGRQRILSA